MSLLYLSLGWTQMQDELVLARECMTDFSLNLPKNPLPFLFRWTSVFVMKRSQIIMMFKLIYIYHQKL